MRRPAPFLHQVATNRRRLTAPLLPAVFDGALMCSDCMENSNNYSKDPDYQSRRGLEAAGGAEFQQYSAAPPSYTSCHPEAAGLPHATSLCNGTANGMREFLPHHSLLQQKQHRGTGEAITTGQSGACQVVVSNHFLLASQYGCFLVATNQQGDPADWSTFHG